MTTVKGHHEVLVGYEVGTGKPIDIPLRHMAVTGQTQQSGKTTTLEALVTRSGATALTFVTKRGEGSFADGRRIAPYFRDRADWQFVTSIIDATLQEKNKFLRPWIMRICRTTRSLKDVQDAVREALPAAKGINEGVFTQLDAYLELIVPEIQRAKLATTLDLAPGLNVMDVSGFATPMQMLFVQSAIDWINERCHDTVLVIPEAWEFIPEGKGSPVKASAIALVRKGAGIGNHIWVDSQDMAGVDKTILRGCTVWLIGVQREANEIKRNLANIPAGIERPKAHDVALLERGQFFACFGRTTTKVYVRPAWMTEAEARAVATGRTSIPAPPAAVPKQTLKETSVTEAEAQELRAENKRLKDELADLRRRLDARDQPTPRAQTAEPSAAPAKGATDFVFDMDAIYAEVKRRAASDQGLLRILTKKPEIEVTVQRNVVQIDGSTLKGRIAKMLANGFFDGGMTNSGVRTELKRTGPDNNNVNIGRVLDELLRDGFLTNEGGGKYHAVADMKVNVVGRD